MDLRLQLLDSFTAQGSDGATYKVCAYDRLAPDPSFPTSDLWQSTGKIEYRLDDGRTVVPGSDGTARIANSQVTLAMPARAMAGEQVTAG